jgi:hypothetical protein
MKNKIFYIFFLFLFPALVSAQTKVRVYGYVIDTNNRGIEMASVYFENSNNATKTNQNGFYEMTADIKDSMVIAYSMVGYETIKHTIFPKKHVFQISVQLRSSDKQLQEVNVVGQRRQTSTLDLVDPSKYRLIPNASGGIESLLITFTGVSSNNELSSQYNVRGGNFDENAVYVNGIEVYRPLLVRAGQQEGLSFINSDMVKNVGFSSGGFDAKYGDKMSSVLDIEYKKPTQFEATLSASLLGASAYVGTANKGFTQMHGIRYKTSQYLLGTLDTKAEYKPSFIDYQTYITWQVRPKWELTFLGNFSQNNYQFNPITRETTFGTYNTGRKLTVNFEGGEVDLFRTAFGALTLNYKPVKGMKLSLLSSVFNTNENETYDILGEYILSEVKMDLNTENKTGESLGIGKYQEHARNRLNATVANVSHLGEYDVDKHKLRWGLTLQSEIIHDKISEWEWRDSAGYSLPFSDKQENLFYTLKSNSTLSSLRSMAFFQDTYKWDSKAGVFSITGGLRGNYWTFNKELLVSPRLSASFLPHWKHDFSFRFATGIYYQAPFYKEIRRTVTDSLGNVVVNLNPNIKAQRSLQFVLGGDHYFRAWGRPFKFTTETYLKLADRIISYTVDNVRIRYSGENDAKAYAAGVDFKLFGELVPGADSWINLSLMNSKEDLLNDSYVKTRDDKGNLITPVTVYPGWMSRSNEQRFVFSMLFQDYLPNNPKYKVHLKCVFSDGLPFGPPSNVQYRNQLRASTYRRVDLGASRVLIGGSDKLMDRPWLKHVKSIWLNAEVFNLMNFKNVNSYYWVNDIYGQQYAVPNYLTGRQLNLKIMVDLK